jgi:hypothetical protein
LRLSAAAVAKNEGLGAAEPVLPQHVRPSPIVSAESFGARPARRDAQQRR